LIVDSFEKLLTDCNCIRVDMFIYPGGIELVEGQFNKKLITYLLFFL